MLFLENMLFSFKKKPIFTPYEDFLNLLCEDQLKLTETTNSFLLAEAMIVNGIEEFDKLNESKKKFHKEICQSKQGKEWFKQAFQLFLKQIRVMRSFDSSLPVIDAYLSLFWFFSVQYPEFMQPTKEIFQKELDPRLRRYYEKKYNIDIYTGHIYDETIEQDNAWKEHFYKASFAFRDGKGNLEISIKEWRAFLSEFQETLSGRPRLVYEFAKEIVEYQKLFFFFSYVIKVERVNQLKHSFLRNGDGSHIDKIIMKVIHAVYAVDEERGLLLKKLYI